MIRRVGVIGAGVMGAGIAAHVANAGVPVVLLDVVPGAAARAVETMLKADPAPFMHRRNARLVEAGDLDADIGKLADCDWIVEAITERPDAKRALYARLEAVRKDGSVISSNTSTIPLAALTGGLPARFAADFLVTHFFNPPRYMRLLEVVAGPTTRPDVVGAIRDFADRRLGKTVVACADTPGFIANRIGTLWIAAAIRHAVDLSLTVEEADAVAGKPFGVPSTGIFGLMDLVGIDITPHVAHSLFVTLPPGDAYRDVYRDEPIIARLIAEGRTGRKAKGGFYSLRRNGEGREKLALDLVTGEYRPSRKAALDSLDAHGGDLRALAEHPDRGGRYARAVLLDTLSYAAALVPGIAGTVDAVDAAMRLGYAWKWGPFELIDRVGAAWLAEALRMDGRAVPELLARVNGKKFYRVHEGKLQAFAPDGDYHDLARPEGVLLLEDIKRAGKPLARNPSASLWDIGDGVACLEFHSKSNSLDPLVMEMVGRAVAMGGKGAFRALVIHNEGKNFSVGANLGLALFAANIAAWGEIETLLEAGQKAYRALRAARFPVVGAPSGMALGGGCEILLHCDAVQAHAETYMGLVEVGVGLIPAWGGCATMLARFATDKKAPRGPMPPVARAFEMIATAQVAKSAAEAQDLGLLRPDDGITANRDRLLADAKARALAMIETYAPPDPVALRLPGPSGRVALALAVQGFVGSGRATPHDVVVSDRLAETLTGGPADAIDETPMDQVLRSGAARFHGAAETSGHAGAHRTHARNRQAAAQLRTPKMPSYQAPLRDMQFALYEMSDHAALCALPGCEDLARDAIDPVLDAAGTFCAEMLFPLNRSGDEQGCRFENGAVFTPAGFPEAYRAFREGGWTALGCDPDYGGQGLPHSVGVLVQEMICSSNLSFGMYPGLGHGAYAALHRHGTQELRDRYLPKLVSGEWAGTMCLTEAQCGTDLGLIRTRAEPAGDGSYRVTGTKIFISGGEHDLTDNILHLVLARLPDAPTGTRGISLFLVPKFLPTEDGRPGARNGVSCGAIEHKMGITASSTCVMNFDAAQGWLVGEPHRGLAAMFTMMNEARLGVAIQGLGLAEVSYQNAVAYARERLQGRALSGKRGEGPADPIWCIPMCAACC